MKKTFFLLITIMIGYAAMAQDVTTPAMGAKVKTDKRGNVIKPPVCYLGVSLGANNPAGIVGFDVSIRMGRYMTFDGGAGTSTWGNKLYAGTKYYLKEMQRGFAFGGGLTFNSGQENVKLNLMTIQGKERVTLALKPQANVFVAVYHYWTLGKRYNRFFAALGGSVPLHASHYDEVYGAPLSDKTDYRIKRLAPGGLMASVGFSFALHRM